MSTSTKPCEGSPSIQSASTEAIATKVWRGRVDPLEDPQDIGIIQGITVVEQLCQGVVVSNLRRTLEEACLEHSGVETPSLAIPKLLLDLLAENGSLVIDITSDAWNSMWATFECQSGTQDSTVLSEIRDRVEQAVLREVQSPPSTTIPDVQLDRNRTDQRSGYFCSVPGYESHHIGEAHLEKLRALWNHYSGSHRPGCFLSDLFCVLSRYEMLGGGGFQAAIPNGVFDVLESGLAITHECFASPLNTYFGSYCSAFFDTDAPFGSCGSFFSWSPVQGSFQVNPPFSDQVIQRTAAHIQSLLSTATQAMSFVVIIPMWKEKEGWKALRWGMGSHFCAHLVINQSESAYCEGWQHRRSNRYRVSSFHTSVFFIQNNAASKQWPVTNDLARDIAAAFAAPLGLSVRSRKRWLDRKSSHQPREVRTQAAIAAVLRVRSTSFHGRGGKKGGEKRKRQGKEKKKTKGKGKNKGKHKRKRK